MQLLFDRQLQLIALAMTQKPYLVWCRHNLRFTTFILLRVKEISRNVKCDRKLLWPSQLFTFFRDVISRLSAFLHDATSAILVFQNSNKRRPCCCSKSILWELNLILSQKLSFVYVLLQNTHKNLCTRIASCLNFICNKAQLMESFVSEGCLKDKKWFCFLIF